MLDWDDADGISGYIDKSWDMFRKGCLDSDTDNIAQYSRRALTQRMADLMETLIK